MSRILLSGGGGYVGRVLLDLLKAHQDEVCVLEHPAFSGQVPAPVVRADLADGEQLKRAVDAAAPLEAVIHLAAIVGDKACAADEARAWAVNVEGTRNVIAASALAGAQRFIFASTCSNYGVSSSEVPADEETPLILTSLYARTKAEGELMTRESSSPSGTVLRLATLFGGSPAMSFASLPNDLVRTAVRSGCIELYGPQGWRPFVHVHDIARALATCLEAPSATVAGTVFNVGDDQLNLRKQELVEAICKLLPATAVRHVEAADPRSYRVSFARVRDRLGFRAGRDLLEGLAEVVSAAQAEVEI